MNWFTDKLYDLGASPRAGEAAWGELAAQDAMSPATRSSYYAGSEMLPDPRAQGWAPDAEKTFQAGIRATPWFAEFKQKFGEEPNLNDPDYDYRRAWAAGARPTVRDPGDNLLHWSSQFKGENHPNRFVNGIDTITGKPVGSAAAMPSDTAWMLPPQGPPTWEAAHRLGASGLTPPPARSAADAYRMGGMANMDEYKQAPAAAWRNIDRAAIEDQYGGADIHGIKLPPVSADEPKAWRDAIIGETPADALVNWGLGGTGKAAKAALALGGLFKLADPAEAANPLKVLRSTSAFEAGKPGAQEFWHRIASRKLDRPLTDIPVEYSGKAPPMSSLVDPSALEGKFLMPLPGDPTMRGRTIRSIDDVPLSVPFRTHGGRPYIDELGGYANTPGAASTAAGRVQKYQDKFGTDVLGVYTKMSPQSMDYSGHAWGLLSRMFPNAPMSKDAVTELNQAIKERTGVANFPSVKNPNLETFVEKLPDATRKAYITAVEQARGKIEGVPDVIAARYAVTEPQLLNTPTSSAGLTMTKLTGETRPSKHPDYPRHLVGEGSFGLGQMLPREVMWQDWVKHVDTLPAYQDRPDRWLQALHVKPPPSADYGQLATPQWVDTTSKYTENVDKMGQTAAFDDYLRNVLQWK